MIWLLVQGQINLIMPFRLSGIDYRMVSVINNTSWIILGFIALVLIIVLEHYLRTGLEKAGSGRVSHAQSSSKPLCWLWCILAHHCS